jgi:hypothetical protein
VQLRESEEHSQVENYPFGPVGLTSSFSFFFEVWCTSSCEPCIEIGSSGESAATGVRGTFSGKKSQYPFGPFV